LFGGCGGSVFGQEFEDVAAADATVDLEVERDEESSRSAGQVGFDAGGVMVVVEKRDLLADRFDGGFVETAVESDGAVAGDAADSAFAEVVVEVLGGFAEQVDVAQIADHGGLAG